MESLYKTSDGEEFELVESDNAPTVASTGSKLDREGERTTTAFEVDESGRKGKSKHVVHPTANLNEDDLMRLKRGEDFHGVHNY